MHLGVLTGLLGSAFVQAAPSVAYLMEFSDRKKSPPTEVEEDLLEITWKTSVDICWKAKRAALCNGPVTPKGETRQTFNFRCKKHNSALSPTAGCDWTGSPDKETYRLLTELRVLRGEHRDFLLLGGRYHCCDSSFSRFFVIDEQSKRRCSFVNVAEFSEDESLREKSSELEAQIYFRPVKHLVWEGERCSIRLNDSEKKLIQLGSPRE